jgi:hypothetical protein
MPTSADEVDPRFSKPYIDVREDRTDPTRHLYVHGGFTGTDARFSFHFPPADAFKGRFYQYTHQLVFSENPDPYNIGMAFAAGAYLVQTNMGGSEYPRGAQAAMSGDYDHSIGGYRVNAAAANYSKVIAAEIYRPQRICGYLYGGSGGAFQTIASAEETTGVWDGFLPFVMGTPNAIPNNFTVRVHALQLLKNNWPAILDAIEPGGSGDPYAGLNDEEQGALEEVTRMGFPPGAWFNYIPMGGGPLALVAGYVPVADPTYFDDFWSKPGYLGTDAASSIRDARVRHETTVVSVLPDSPLHLELASPCPLDLVGGKVVVLSGDAQGKSVPLGRVEGTTVELGRFADPTVASAIRSGDTVRIDNSEYLALETYHRHQIPPPGSPFDYPDVHDYFRHEDGSPKYPQRDVMVGPIGAFNAAGQVNSGNFFGKMIVVENLLDGDAVPYQADWYRSKVEALLGDGLDDRYRLWYIDNAQHMTAVSTEQQRHVISYQGVLEQGLRDLSAWVEDGVAPPPSSSYHVREGQVHVPPSAAARQGIQPVIELSVNGSARAAVPPGQPVSFIAQVEAPPNTGEVVAADWDFLGNGNYSDRAELGHGTRGPVTITASHTFTTPGTYFPALRVASQREGDRNTPYARVQNLGRVRVVVR